jgi:hypothetical protein
VIDSVTCTAQELEDLETIKRLVISLLNDDRNKVLSAYRTSIELNLQKETS